VETISIVENLSLLGLRLPSWITGWARQQTGDK